jgi:type II secretory pathway component PulK
MRIPTPNPHQRSDGIALIMVLVVIVVLSILAFGFAYSMKVETTLARHAMFSSDLDWAGRSGIEVAKWVLAEESKGQNAMFDSLRNKWAGGPGESNSPLMEIDLKNYPLYRPDDSLLANLSIEIVDNDRKFNINVADEIRIKQALTLIGVDAGAFTAITSSILDWRDPDKNPHMGGAETDYYEGLTPSYFAKDGPFDEITELLRIKGVTWEMFWGSSGGTAAAVTRPRGPRSSQFEEPTYAVGLNDLFTCLSSRLVNMNTAPATVFQMMFPEFDTTIADAIIRERNGPDGAPGTDDDTPFRSSSELMFRVRELAQIVGPPSGQPGQNPATAQIASLFTARSLVFEVRVTASIGNTKRDYVGILRRNNAKDIQTLNLYWK